MTTRRLFMIVMLCLCAGLTGCSGGVEADGKVTRGGQPFTMGEGEGMNISLTSEDGKAGGGGKVEADGTFKLQGADGGAIPAGRYKVSYTLYAPPPSDPKMGTPPPTNVTTKEVWDVSSSSKSFTLDLPAPKK